MSGRNIWESFIEFHDRKNTEKLLSRVPDLKEKQLLDVIPDHIPVNTENLINVVNRKFDIPKTEISETLNRLIDKKKISSSVGIKSRTVYIRKSL